jgi:hypothetical protein
MASYSIRKKGGQKMKSWLWNGMIAAAIALPALGGVARAQSADNDGCSNATLKGDYAFVVTSWSEPTGVLPWVPQVVIGIVNYDGNGNRTQIDYIGDSLRTRNTTAFGMGETGTYTVNPDCTGREQIQLNAPNVPPGTSHGVIDSVFVISGGGRSIHAVVAKAILPGATQAMPDQTRVDSWKVGSEQDN